VIYIILLLVFTVLCIFFILRIKNAPKSAKENHEKMAMHAAGSPLNPSDYEETARSEEGTTDM